MPTGTLSTHPIHLGLGATASVEPAFTGEIAWYEGYQKRHEADGAEARLVAQHRFSSDWPMWEMHPQGSEVVLCLSGALVLHQEYPDGRREKATLAPGDYAINEPGVWHTADVADEATALFITAGKDTQHRPR